MITGSLLHNEKDSRYLPVVLTYDCIGANGGFFTHMVASGGRGRAATSGFNVVMGALRIPYRLPRELARLLYVHIESVE